jgi:hypothetical protein
MQKRYWKWQFSAGVVCSAVLGTAGCNKKADTYANYKSAIDTYYAAHPACLWADEVKFPLQVATSDATKTAPYDALVDQGLLVRSTVEKKKLVVLSEQANNYDLSDKGRTVWTADTSQPGFGNFCYGHRKVESVTSATPTNDQPGASTEVTYRYTVADAPGWATAPETESAFAEIKAAVSGAQSASATLRNTPDGWAVASAPSGAKTPATAADGKVVQ